MPKTKATEDTSFDPSIFAGEANAGFQDVQTDDLGIPFMIILQKLSPECDEESDKFVEGLKPGQIIHSVTKEILGDADNPSEFIPCHYRKMFVEWQPRESGGGFVKQHGDSSVLNECKRDERGRDVMLSGNLIVTTGYFSGLYKVGDETFPIILSMASTQLKKARQWLATMLNLKFGDGKGGKFTPPMYSHIYLLTTRPESNTKGGWYGWSIERGPVIQDTPLLEAARGLTSRNLLPAATQPGPSDDSF